MGLFKRRQAPVEVSPHVLLENKYLSSRNNLLLVIIFSLINIVMAALGNDSYFLFSASIPYYIVLITALWCGKLPEHYYEESGLTEADFLPNSVLVVGVIIAVIILALYLLFWLMSKKKVGWLIAALVFFALDSIFMLVIFGFSADMIIDIVFHVWVVVSLAIGINAHSKLKNLSMDLQPIPDLSENNDGFDYPEFTAEGTLENNEENK